MPPAWGGASECDMDIERLREYCLSLGDVAEKMPFGKFAARFDSILVFYVAGHMFCMTDIDDFRSVTVRSTPEELALLLERRSALSKPLNLSARYWVQVDFGGDIPESEIYGLIARSYEIVKAKYTPRSRRPHPGSISSIDKPT